MPGCTTVVNVATHRCDVRIDRTTKWGNRNRIGHNGIKTREEAIAAYRADILARPDLLAALHELDGLRLGCHCKPKACHGDVLVELIEEMNAKNPVRKEAVQRFLFDGH